MMRRVLHAWADGAVTRFPGGAAGRLVTLVRPETKQAR